ncbi:NADPH-dependent FMN reductase [Pseudorhodoferax sp.]|uniref:NADPH-dependent FMN reductase n=1 Tax=Pseudorhodoferax sp. TaxID=1993553 RepID=UPI002DD6628C|nr:NAD(P)H-dependent oxidoreductase [Pseudorhodoferax sp.]
MATPPHLLVLPASARSGSLNRSLAAAAATLARGMGLQVSEYEPAALEMPLYNGDLERSAGMPAAARRLFDAIAASDGLLVVTPEYNGYPTPLFINAFDWLSRIEAAPPQPSGLALTAERPAALLSASPGVLGGQRSLNLVRGYLEGAFQMLVVPQQFALGKAHEAFDEQGLLRDPKAAARVSQVLQAWARLVRGQQALG